MINMMEQTGADLSFAGTDFYGNAVTATDLIMAAGKSLTIVDGKPIVDLSQLGTQFNLGTEEMRAGLAEGIETLAQNEIDMLDAAIKLLETIVAMEEIGKIDTDKNGLEMDELFNLGPDGEILSIKDLSGIAQSLREAGVPIDQIRIGSNTL
jgi:hypothetical protein